MPEHALFIIKILSTQAKLKLEDVYLVLEKLKINLTFNILGDEYGKSCSYASNVFKQNVPIMSHFLK